MRYYKNEKRKLSFKNAEVRSFLDEGEGGRHIEGIIPYGKRSVPLWGDWVEIISKTAFKKTLADGAEVRACVNHDYDKILGSTKSGTLTLEHTDEGLVCRCRLPDTSYANDLYAIVERGDVTQMSFGMRIIECTDNWEDKTTTVREAALTECSFGVAFPAYPDTDSDVYKRAVFEKRDIDMDALAGVLAKEEVGDADRQIITNTIRALNDALGHVAVEKGPPNGTPPAGEPSDDTPPAGQDTAEADTGNLTLQIEAELAS